MPNHPAKFSDSILKSIAGLLDTHGWPERVLDPFVGVGRVHELKAPAYSVGIELEPEWTAMHPRNLVGNALRLPFRDASFDAFITSPSYGNRLADHHDAKERCTACRALGIVNGELCPKCDGAGHRAYTRMTYRHQLGRPLHPDNSGQLQWGSRYRKFHEDTWTELLRVLQPDALGILNISNHIRNHVEQPVSEWHLRWFVTHGCRVVDCDVVETDRMGFGANRDARCPYENVFVFRYTPERTRP